MVKVDTVETSFLLQKLEEFLKLSTVGGETQIAGEEVLKLFFEMKDHIRELESKNEELSKLLTENDKFFSIIAHDLRSPFNAFLGLTQLMSDELPNLSLDEIREITLGLRNSATGLYRLLENLLEWTRIQRGLTSINCTSLSLIHKIVENLQPAFESVNNKEIALSYDIPEDLTVFADGIMLGIIIRNLVSNAVKFTPKGGHIKISAHTVSNGLVEIAVQDSGIGMDEDMINNLFRHDVYTNRKGTEGESSTGLGLIICKDFIEAQGGKLRIESEKGHGSTFYFTLPKGI